MIYVGIDPANRKPNALAAYVPDTDELYLTEIAPPLAVASGSPHPQLRQVLLGLRAAYPGHDIALAAETQWVPTGGKAPTDPREKKRFYQRRANMAGQALRLSEVAGGFRNEAQRLGCSTHSIQPSRGKFALAEHGKATPAEMDAAARHIFKLVLVSDDQAHALGIALALQLTHLRGELSA